ncbi:MAG: NUDIX domain-containing protein [Nitrospinota bacterium]
MTAFLRYRGKVLLLRRSGRVGTYRGRWSGVSGYLEPEDPSPLARALREVEEEVGLSASQLSLQREGEPFTFYDPEEDRSWTVHPFLFDAGTDAIRLDWESREARWVAPEELERLPTVPRLAEALRAVLEAR